jgi:hypothetical protein
MTRLKTLSNYLKFLGNKWEPYGGPQKIKKVWDGRSFNLRHFVEYPYVAILGHYKDPEIYPNLVGIEFYFDLVELDDKEQARNYWKWNHVGQGCFRILELDTGLTVAEWYSPDQYGEKDRRNRCDI